MRVNDTFDTIYVCGCHLVRKNDFDVYQYDSQISKRVNTHNNHMTEKHITYKQKTHTPILYIYYLLYLLASTSHTLQLGQIVLQLVIVICYESERNITFIRQPLNVAVIILYIYCGFVGTYAFNVTDRIFHFR